MNRVCARWVPRILTAEHLTKRVELSKQLIKKVNRGGIRFLYRIIVCLPAHRLLTVSSIRKPLCHLNINERLTLLCFSDCFTVSNADPVFSASNPDFSAISKLTFQI
jgi:hypothetical protein